MLARALLLRCGVRRAGVPYSGTSRTAYLPDTHEGREVCAHSCCLHCSFSRSTFSPVHTHAVVLVHTHTCVCTLEGVADGLDGLRADILTHIPMYTLSMAEFGTCKLDGRSV